MLTIESHDPVHNERASFETPRQLTRLSCPWRVPTRSPRRTSQTCIYLSASCFLYACDAKSRTLHSKSS
jgi:hypothetical protein